SLNRAPIARRSSAASPSGYLCSSSAVRRYASCAPGGTPKAPSLDDSFSTRLTPGMVDSPPTYGEISSTSGRGRGVVMRQLRSAVWRRHPTPLADAVLQGAAPDEGHRR